MTNEYKTSFSVIIIFGVFSEKISEYLNNYLNFLSYNEIEIIILSENIDKLKINKMNFRNNIKLIRSDSVLPSEKRNEGAKNATKDFLVFIDDDAYPSKNYFDNIQEICKRGYEVFGGPQIAPLEQQNLPAQLSDSFYSNKMINPFNFRYNLNSKDGIAVKELPTVNFIIKRKLFFEIGGFDKKYWPGEDSILCDEINKKTKIYYFNKIFVFHARRETFLKHFRQISRYGFNRGKLIFRLKKVFSIFYFLPLIFLFLFFPLFFKYKSVLIILAVIYYLVIFTENVLKKNKVLQSLILPFFAVISYFLYGINFLIGLTNFSDKKLPDLGR